MDGIPENGRSFRKGVYESKAGKEEPNLTGMRNDSAVFL